MKTKTKIGYYIASLTVAILLVVTIGPFLGNAGGFFGIAVAGALILFWEAMR